ncbi:MAG: hypothetical protein NTW44_07685 [Nitrospirae bacterium]|nr:hypothetical protein [Nitrospirota bacterium]
MKSPDEIKPAIISLYAEMGKDTTELRYFSEKDMMYYVARNDGSRTSILRKHIDDYIDSGDKSAKLNIMKALSNFKHWDA